MAIPMLSMERDEPPIQGNQALNERYVYAPIPVKGWIRILELHPGRDRLTCSLRHSRLEDVVVAYEALSYVWGRDALQRAVDIECSGRKLSIGSNVARALTNIRCDSETRLLWVDAVCIDQDNKAERSQQVQQMGDIYASAMRVLVWMGEDRANEADECFALIQGTCVFLTKLLRQYKTVKDIPSAAYGDGSIAADSQGWDKVRRLMDSEWFSRIWVLQEVGLARSAVMVYGKSSMEWSFFVELMLHVASRPDLHKYTGYLKTGLIWDVFEDIWCSFKNSMTWRNELPLMQCLNSTSGDAQSFSIVLNVARPHQATDQRDRVYAFLSHPRASVGAARKEQIVTVDYNNSVEEVYLDTAIRIIHMDPYPWTVLTCVDHRMDSPSLSGMRPSWVPRWDEGWSVYWLGYPSMWYRASGSTTAPFLANVSRLQSSLEVTGVCLDTIAWSSKSFDDEELKFAHQTEGAPIQALWQELKRHDSNPVYVSQSLNKEYAFSLAIAAGRASDEGPAEDNPGRHHSVYRIYKDMICSSNCSRGTPETYTADTLGDGPGNPAEVDALIYINNQRRALHNRRLFLTSKGYYGVGHRSLEAGDICAVFRGANVPFVLRAASSDEQSCYAPRCYRLVGEAFIQGYMNGEALENLNKGSDCQGSDLTEVNMTIV